MAEEIATSSIGSVKPAEDFALKDAQPAGEKLEKRSREEEAELALKSTRFTPGVCKLLILLFLLTLVSVPILQLATQNQTFRADGLPALADLFRILPAREKVETAHTATELWDLLLPSAGQIKSAEKAIENESIVSQWLRPYVQAILTEDLHAGAEQVYPGRDGWLFYRSDVDYITGPAFLDFAQLERRSREAEFQPDPVKAIIDFRNQLAARGIDLVVVPVPVKPCIDGEMMTVNAKQNRPLQNASFAEFKAAMKRERVPLFDPAPLLLERKAAFGGVPLYLETDTHWRPETMEFVAQELATFIGVPVAHRTSGARVVSKEIAAFGDILTMLKLPAVQNTYKPQKVTVQQILQGNTLWRPNKDSSILLLGDSFCNIFSLEPMGWGEAAGFAEHLSLSLGGQPLDCILRNSDGSFATREILSRELARGHDRLAGKKMVVWEFAVRELAFGNWKLIEMKTGLPQAAHFLHPKPGEEMKLAGTVEAVSPVPLAGSVPYKDHIFTVHLIDIVGPQRLDNESLQALVYLWSMRDNVWMPAARLRPGDRITVNLRAWTDVSAQYEKINRSEIDDPATELEEPTWGDVGN